MFDLASAHARLGLTDATKDYWVTLCLDTAKAIAEKHLDRSFDFATETVKLYDFHGKQLHLQRYPLTAVTSIVGDGTTSVPTTEYKAHLTGGYIEFFTVRSYKEVDVTYSGGYSVLPPDLVLALWLIFDALWSSTPGAGKAAGSVSGGTTGAIKSIETPDVGRIVYQDPSASIAQSDLVGVNSILGHDAICLLAPYKRYDA